MSAGTVEETEAHHLNAISIHFCVQILQMPNALEFKGQGQRTITGQFE